MFPILSVTAEQELWIDCKCFYSENIQLKILSENYNYWAFCSLPMSIQIQSWSLKEKKLHSYACFYGFMTILNLVYWIIL